MTAQEILIDRRRRSREGAMGQLEDIAYAAMRRHGVIDGMSGAQMNSSTSGRQQKAA